MSSVPDFRDTISQCRCRWLWLSHSGSRLSKLPCIEIPLISGSNVIIAGIRQNISWFQGYVCVYIYIYLFIYLCYIVYIFIIIYIYITHTVAQVDGPTPKRWCSRGHDKRYFGVAPYTFQEVYIIPNTTYIIYHYICWYIFYFYICIYNIYIYIFVTMHIITDCHCIICYRTQHWPSHDISGPKKTKLTIFSNQYVGQIS